MVGSCQCRPETPVPRSRHRARAEVRGDRPLSYPPMAQRGKVCPSMTHPGRAHPRIEDRAGTRLERWLRHRSTRRRARPPAASAELPSATLLPPPGARPAGPSRKRRGSVARTRPYCRFPHPAGRRPHRLPRAAMAASIGPHPGCPHRRRRPGRARAGAPSGHPGGTAASLGRLGAMAGVSSRRGACSSSFSTNREDVAIPGASSTLVTADRGAHYVCGFPVTIRLVRLRFAVDWISPFENVTSTVWSCDLDGWCRFAYSAQVRIR
jgi:hypothetical protein